MKVVTIASITGQDGGYRPKFSLSKGYTSLGCIGIGLHILFNIFSKHTGSKTKDTPATEATEAKFRIKILISE